VSFAAFWKLEGAIEHPLVSIPQLKQRATWALSATSLLTLSGIFAIMNGVVPALAQDSSMNLGMSAEEVSLWILMPYALAGLLMGPLSGRLAATVGYRTMLRIGLGGTIVVLGLMVANVETASRLVLLLLSVAVGITYAGIGNIMLNGLGIVLSPKENPGFLPGLNAGAFNLGAGLSFAVIYAVKTATTPADGGAGGYYGGIVAGLVILVLALAASFLIPKPVAAEVPAGAPADR
jgi:MFS family permease